jgi:hypothetical protein
MNRSYTSSPPQAPPWRVAGLLYLLPVLDPNNKQHILSPAKVSFLSFFLSFFLSHNVPTDKNEVTMLSQLILVLFS